MIKTIITFLVLAIGSPLLSQYSELSFHSEDSEIFRIKENQFPVSYFPFEYLHSIFNIESRRLNKVIFYEADTIKLGPVTFIPTYQSELEYVENNLELVKRQRFNGKEWIQTNVLNYSYSDNSIEEIETFFNSDGSELPSQTLTSFNYKNDILEDIETYILNDNEEELLFLDTYDTSSSNDIITKVSSTYDEDILLGQVGDEYIFINSGSELIRKNHIDDDGHPLGINNYSKTQNQLLIENSFMIHEVNLDIDGQIEKITFFRKTALNGGGTLIEEKLRFEFFHFPNKIMINVHDANFFWDLRNRIEYYFDETPTVSNQSLASPLPCKLANPIMRGQQLHCNELRNATIHFYNELGQILATEKTDGYGNFEAPTLLSSGFVIMSAINEMEIYLIKNL